MQASAINIKQLQTFYWAAKLGSFTAAAERLNATQSTVSMRIQDLEGAFDCPLFDRSQRTARLTAKGRELVVYVEQMMNLMAEIQERVAAPETTLGHLRIGVAEVISITWLPLFVKTLHERYPRLQLELDEALTTDLTERLRAGALDLILSPGRIPGYNLITQSLGSVEFAWMASPELGIQGHRLRPRDLQKWTVIALARESHHHNTIEDWFRADDAYCRRIATCKSMAVAASLTAAGLGISYLPLRCYADLLDQGKLVTLDTEPKLKPVEFVATISGANFNPVAQRMASIAAEMSDFERGKAH
jgi:DNA-binding transcriptional LysR family regulator